MRWFAVAALVVLAGLAAWFMWPAQNAPQPAETAENQEAEPAPPPDEAAPAEEFSEGNPFMPQQEFDTAVITYRLEGATRGEETLYIKGDRRTRHRKAEKTGQDGKPEVEDVMIITTPDRVVRVDLTTGKALATGNLTTLMAREFDNLPETDRERLKKVLGPFGSAHVPATPVPGMEASVTEGELMGRPVEIAKLMGVTTYTWKGPGIVLKREGEMGGGKILVEAASIETGVDIPDSVFQIPEGVNPPQDVDNEEELAVKARSIMQGLAGRAPKK